jgi:hypothetical protein
MTMVITITLTLALSLSIPPFDAKESLNSAKARLIEELRLRIEKRISELNIFELDRILTLTLTLLTLNRCHVQDKRWRFLSVGSLVLNRNQEKRSMTKTTN